MSWRLEELGRHEIAYTPAMRQRTRPPRPAISAQLPRLFSQLASFALVAGAAVLGWNECNPASLRASAEATQLVHCTARCTRIDATSQSCQGGYVSTLHSLAPTDRTDDSFTIYTWVYGSDVHLAPSLSDGAAPCTEDIQDDRWRECLHELEAVLNASPCRRERASTNHPPAPFDLTACPAVALRRRGNQFERIVARDELLRALGGEIDSINDALLLAAFDGQRLQCPTNRLQPGLHGVTGHVDLHGAHITSEWESCNVGSFRDVFTVVADGTLHRDVEQTQIGPSTCISGRRPAQLAPLQPSERHTLGSFFADMGALEAASVAAFRQLTRELAALQAPAMLVARARAAARDEVAHARIVGRLAQKYGARVRVPHVAQSQLRSARELALDNVTEGCVRETFAALVATYQAQAALDPDVRAALRRIAEDETRHAQLAWDTHAWLQGELDDSQRAELERARDTATRELLAEPVYALRESQRALAGLPPLAVARALLSSIDAALALQQPRSPHS